MGTGNKKEFTISVMNESGVIYYGECDTLFVPTDHEQIAILAHHTPLIAKLSNGNVSIKNGHKNDVLASIKGGLLYVGENEATVLVDL